MIPNPEIKNPIWNPMPGLQLCETAAGGKCIALSMIGETGETATFLIEKPVDVQKLIDLLAHGKKMLETANKTSFEESLRIHGDGIDRNIPDDPSSLFD
jgi:hypothetical protein